MRVDLLLKHLCITKSRSLARRLCDNGAVLLNGRTPRSSALVRPGDRITIHFARDTLTIELIEIPVKQLSRAMAPDYYRRVETPAGETRPRDDDGLDDI